MLVIARPSSARLGVTAGLSGGVLKTGGTGCVLVTTEGNEFALSLTVGAILAPAYGERGRSGGLVPFTKRPTCNRLLCFSVFSDLPSFIASCALVDEGAGEEELVLSTIGVVRLGTLNTVTVEGGAILFLVLDGARSDAGIEVR